MKGTNPLRSLYLRYPSLSLLAPCVALAFGAGLIFRQVALDDAYITFRYAANLASGVGFVYNPGERVLSTTAPLFGLMLAALGRLGFDIPAAANLLCAIGLAGLATALYFLGEACGRRVEGAVAAALAGLSPLLLATFGMETVPYLALIVAAFSLYRHGQLGWAAIALAFATMLRPDGALVAAVLAAFALWEQRRPPLRAGSLYLAATAPLYLWLWWYFGSPLPVTGSAKVAQAIVGWASYLEGLLQLLWAHLNQSPALAAGGLLALLGAYEVARRERWLLPLAAWAALFAAAYQALGVASYDWYYAPFVPTVAFLVALGARGLRHYLATWSATLPWRRLLIMGAPAALLLATLAGHLPADAAVLRNAPGAKYEVYRDVGLWLRENAGPRDLVGTMEVGIIGYYAQRPMVDYLGLLRPSTIAAIQRKDLTWILSHYQPEWLVFGSVNPLWNYPIEVDQWFLRTYASRYSTANPGFWGSPLSVYQRQGPRTEPIASRDFDLDFGGLIRLKKVEPHQRIVERGHYFTVAMVWEATQRLTRDYGTFLHLIREDGVMTAQHDITVFAATWRPGEPQQYYYHMWIPEDARPGRYQLLAGVYTTSEPMKRLPLLNDPSGMVDAAEVGFLEVR